MTAPRRALIATTALVGALTATMPVRAATSAPSAAPAAGRSVLPARAVPVRTAAVGGTGLHWLMRPGQRELVVDVVDRTGWAWPVRAASREWATPHVRYRYGPSCRARMPCVVVREGWYGLTDWSGVTHATPGQMQTFAGTVQVQLNDSYRMSAGEHRAVACHELGHALGLDHDSRTSSCVQSQPHATAPDSLDRARLEAMYRLG